jgi:DnaJ-domain-containing protein 1
MAALEDEPSEFRRLLFKRTEPADPFAVFAETYHIRTPQDAPPPKPEPEEPQPVELGLTRSHQVMGVPLGASRQEISQACKKLAFIHHPDRVAGMGPEARQYSEERMKEINAAYAELRQRGAQRLRVMRLPADW